jgi:hypothetical protein
MLAGMTLTASHAQAQSETTLPEVKVKSGAAPTTTRRAQRPSAAASGADPRCSAVRHRHQQRADAGVGCYQPWRRTAQCPGITMGAAEGGSIGNNFNLRGFSRGRTSISTA